MSTASLQRGKTSSPNECPAYNTKQSNGEAPLQFRIVAPDRVLSMSHLSCVQTNDLHEIELFDHLTVCKKMTYV